MIEIIPAIMPKTFHELRERVESVSHLVGTIQIDVMDGIFVPEKSWPYSEDENMIRQLVQDEQPLPSVDDLDFEIDLMVADPYNTIDGWLAVCASRIIFHIESISDPKKIFPMVRSYIDAKRGSGECVKPIEFGIALDIDTPNETIEEWVSYADFIQCMGIARIGYQGEPFDKRVIPKIESLRDQHPGVIISIDGAVNADSIPGLVKAGAERLVVGSAIFANDNIAEAIDNLRTIANEASD